DIGPASASTSPTPSRVRGRWGPAASSTPQNIEVSDPALDDPTQSDAQTEPSMAVRGNDVLAAWIDGRGLHSLSGLIAAAYSTDGGHTFAQLGVPPTPPGGGVWTADPIVAVNEKTGDFYLCALFDPISPLDEHGVAVARGAFNGG